MSEILPVLDRRALLLREIARASIAAGFSADGWVERPEITTAAQTLGLCPTKNVLRLDLRWLCEAGQIERRVEGSGFPRHRRVWYRIRRVS